MGRNRSVDRRGAGLLLTLAAVLGGGAWVAIWPSAHAPNPIEPAPESRDALLLRHFEAAAIQLHARQYGLAERSLQQVLVMAPTMPEAHVNLGYALLGQGRLLEARGAFETAIDLRPEQANAYHGLALCHEAMHDLELAIGGMRSYLHLAREEDENHLARARAALWEWETELSTQRGRPRP
jgi:Tfp pilus assembly protein PilF